MGGREGGFPFAGFAEMPTSLCGGASFQGFEERLERRPGKPDPRRRCCSEAAFPSPPRYKSGSAGEDGDKEIGAVPKPDVRPRFCSPL